MNKIIQGEWNGELIWRNKTAAERMRDSLLGHDCHASSEDGCGGCEQMGNTTDGE